MISENLSKNRPGRPRAFSREITAAFGAMGIGVECQTLRGKQNHWYVMEALRVLKHDPACAWLGIERDAMTAGTAKMRRTILAELGRLRDDPESLRAIAHQVCELKPRTADAVAMIRTARTGRPPAPDQDILVDQLLAVLNRHRAQRPGLTFDMMRDALRRAVAAADAAKT